MSLEKWITRLFIERTSFMSNKVHAEIRETRKGLLNRKLCDNRNGKIIVIEKGQGQEKGFQLNHLLTKKTPK